MNESELLTRLQSIEFDDFEVKEAKSDLPKNIWETVCAFANTSGVWIVLGVAEKKIEGKSTFEVQGVKNAEKLEQDFWGILRSDTKFNVVINAESKVFTIDGKTLLLFHILSSEVKPVYFNKSLINVFVRKGSGDQHATENEIAAMQRDQAFGCRSEMDVPNTSFSDINLQSLHTYRRRVSDFNPEFLFNGLPDEEFCSRIGILHNGNLTYASLLMFGKWEPLRNAVRNFWIDYLEIPGTSYTDAVQRYTFRLQEYENIWEYYNVLIQRLRNFVDNPFMAGPDGFSPDDNSQLYALREGLINMLSHADYFSPIHSTIRVFDDRIEFQNPGRFAIDLNLIGKVIISSPRNPGIIKLFRYAKLSENAGYGMTKLLTWEKLTGGKVSVDSDITLSNVIFNRKHVDKNDPENVTENVTERFNLLLDKIKVNPFVTTTELAIICNVTRMTIHRDLEKMKQQGLITRVGPDKGGHWEVTGR